MATDPEAQTQLARLLRNDALRAASLGELRAAVDNHFEVLVDGIVAETSASDDVVDQESGLSFVRLRLQSLSSVLADEQASRLLKAIQEKIESW
jgi:hypothetical protein